MEYKIDEMYNTVIIKLSGKLLGGSFSEEFNSVLHRFLAEGKNNIIVEMSGVNFMNSSGLGILISGLSTMKKSNGSFKLAKISPSIGGILSITMLDQIFEQYDTVGEALNSIN